MAPPKGLLIGPPSKPWRIGRELGRGACGSVHQVDRPSSSSSAGSSSGYVVKIAPVPPSASSSSGGAARKSKKKKTPLERNADLIYHENTLYRNVLNNLRGCVVPEVPQPGDGGPPGYGDIDGYRFLCMEAMDGPISDVIPTLLSATSSSTGKRGRPKSSSTTIDLGPIASTMISHVESLHSLRLLFVDVKADNFMLATAASAATKKKKNKNSTPAELLADRVRLIDFGLVESYRDVASGRHREDIYPDSQFVGTPEYASINVLSGHTPSRRDDMEAVGYVIADLVLQAVNYGTKMSSSKSSSSGGGTFPWSTCQSDEDVLRVKIAEIEGSGSPGKRKKKNAGVFFSALGADGNGAAEDIMRLYFDAVRELEYSDKPDYDALMDIVSDLTVNVGASAGSGDGDRKRAAAPSSARTSASRKKATPEKKGTAAGRSARASARGRAKAYDSDDDDDVEYDEDVPPTDAVPARRKGRSTTTAARGRRRAANTGSSGDEDSDVIMVDVSSDDDDVDDYKTCNSGQQMDWEVVDDENEKPTARRGTGAAAADTSPSSAGKGTLQVHVVEGPMKGESFGLGGACANTVTVGRNPPKPRNSSSNGTFKLGKDKDAAPSHVKLALYSASGSHSVRVTDLKAAGGTTVNGKEVATGKYKQAFVGSKITIGKSTLQIKKG